jgi:hypothetical protein
MDIDLLTVYIHECVCANMKFCQFICEMWSLNIREGLQLPYVGCIIHVLLGRLICTAHLV